MKFIVPKIISILALIFILGSVEGYSQWMKIDSLGGAPDPSAALEVSDTSRGFLPPRLTETQMNAISSPASGLLIYNTDSAGYYYYDGSSWESVGSGPSGSSSSTSGLSYQEISHNTASYSVTSLRVKAIDYEFKGDSLLLVDNSSTYSAFIAREDLIVNVTSSFVAGAGAYGYIRVNDASINVGSGSGGTWSGTSTPLFIEKDDTITIHLNGTPTGTWFLKMVALSIQNSQGSSSSSSSSSSVDSDELTWSFSSTYTDSTLRNAPVGTFITHLWNSSNVKSQTSSAPTQSTSDMAANGIQLYMRKRNAASTSNEPASVQIQVGKNLSTIDVLAYANTGKTTPLSIDLITNGTNTLLGIFKSYDPETGILSLDGGHVFSSNLTTGHTLNDFNGEVGYLNGYFSFSTAGSTSTSSSSSTVSSVDESGIVLIKDVKSSATHGGTYTTGAWQIRDLNTLEGDSSFVSLSSNMFLLNAGVYKVEWEAPGYEIGYHVSRLYDLTNSAVKTYGSSEHSDAAGNVSNRTTGATILEISSATSFRIEHRGSQTKASNGLGIKNSFGGTNTYTEIRITKLDKVFGSGTSSFSSSSSDTLDENVFSAVIDGSAGVSVSVISENTSFISSVVRNATGDFTVNFNTSFFTVIPSANVNMIHLGALNGGQCEIQTISTNSIRIRTANTAGAASDYDFNLSVHRQGADYRYNTSGASASALAAANDTAMIISDSDQGTQVTVDDESNIRFMSGGSESARITATGFMGLGTSNPTAVFHVMDSIHIENGSNGRKLGLFGNGEIEALSGQSLYLNRYIASNISLVSGGGNVGIGTSSPHAALQFNNNISTNRTLVLYEDIDNEHQFYGLGINASQLRYQVADTLHRHVFFAGSGNTSSRELMRIQGDGKVGIGTTAPVSPLHIVGAYPANANSGQLHIAGPVAGDNMNIGRTATYGFVQTQGSEPLALNPIGNYVGVGITAPMAQLNVIGTANADLTNNGYFMSGVVTGPNIAMDNNEIQARNNGAKSPLYIQNNGGDLSIGNNKLYVMDGGNVGIGLTNPEEALHINGNLKFIETTGAVISVDSRSTNAPGSGLSILAGSAGAGTFGNPGGNLVLQAGDGYGSAGFGQGGSVFITAGGNTFSSSDPGDIVFRTRTGTTMMERIRILGANGNVGIGTSVPSMPLQVDGGSDASLSTGGYIMTNASSTTNIVIDDNEIIARNNGAKSPLYLQNDGGDIEFVNNQFTMSDAGFFGIANSAPQFSLHITDNTGNVAIMIEDDAELAVPTGEDFEIVHANKTTGAIENRRFIINTTGLVGIGTTSPGYQLDVQYDGASAHVAKFENTNTSTNADGILIQIGPTTNPGTANNFMTFNDGDGTKVGEIQGNGSGGITYSTTSDRRLKTNIQSFNSGLDYLGKINPRIYERKSLLGTYEVGFIAQELQQIYPQAVSGDSTIALPKGQMGVDYGQLTPVLAAAIKELHELVKIQEIKIEKLTAENSELKTELNELDKLKANQIELQEQLSRIQKQLNRGVSKR